jgi:lipopolysaccharide/colanic/teichoic acid biosynthesis glycosyltransferase
VATTTKPAASHEPPATRHFRRADSSYPRGKRILDVVVGSLMLVASLPVLAAIRVAMVATGDRGPFLYRAERIGEGGRPVRIFKIRSMTHGSSGSALTARDDDRVTRVGRILRRYKLDELPQLWNVVRGEMALVGPRPEDASFVDLGVPLHRRVFTARPGVTGLAQLAFRHETDLLVGNDAERHYREVILPAKLALDADYLDRQSVRLDLAILGRTAASVLGRGEGAPAR